MTNRDRLLQAILLNPADDTPRRIYADALADEGVADWSEFIKVQLELASYPFEKCDSIYPGCAVSGGAVVWHDHKCPMYAVANRSRELLKANFGFWTDGLPESLVMQQCPDCVDFSPDYETNVVECGQCDCTGLVLCYDHIDFSRGFVSSIELSTDDFLRHAAAIFAAQPVTSVRLTDREPSSYLMSMGTGWLRAGTGHYEDRQLVIPGQIFDFLGDGKPLLKGDFRHYRGSGFDAAAWADLSAACVSYGRTLAHLPLLGPP